ncbi:diguanylate cyclase [Rhodoferax sp.]|uniref:diguanylate cyclase n=1 Tax=Rhodoferax sp. TaxID=50421 RepID=UPI0026257DC6|nr:diguanylate cyclase [Rhodoferax sp.]MDD2919898.1 diguanylate cyclase [Rhodoferax sp.]
MNENDLIYSFAKANVIQASGLIALMMPQTLGAGVAVKAMDGRYKLVNQVMQGYFSKTSQQFSSLTDAELFPTEVAAQLQQSDAQIMAGAATCSDQLDCWIDGRSIQCLWFKFPVHGPDGQILFIGAAMLDTARMGDIDKMQKSLELLQNTNQELQKTLVELSKLASTDKLTGAWNRRRLEEALLNEMDRLKRYDHPLSMLILDIDLFKKVNDEHGHSVGDEVLVKLANVLQSSLRASDTLTRWGGEEFVVLCPNTTLSTVTLLAERLRTNVAMAIFPTAKHVTISLGAAECMVGEAWEDWFKRADAALYRAKAGGRNQVQVAPEAPQRDGAGNAMTANLVRLSWHAAYECGNPVIDEQHRGLFADANHLLGAVLSDRPEAEVAALVNTLVRDVVQHFKDEEVIIRAAGYPHAAEHAAIHNALVDKAVLLVKHFHDGTLAIGELFQFLAHDVVARHMLGADREFFGYLQPKPKS